MPYDDKIAIVGESALEHGLSPEYIERMWADESVEGFEVQRLPPRETNVIAIRFVRQPGGVLEMIAENNVDDYYIFHAQLVPNGKKTSLLTEAFELYFGL